MTTKQHELTKAISVMDTVPSTTNDLSHDELKLMLLLWNKGSSIFVTQMEIEKQLSDNGLIMSASLELCLHQLVQKGYLGVECNNYYLATSYEQYARHLASVSFTRWGCNTILDYVALLYEADMISKDDIDDLYCFCMAIRNKSD